MANKNQKHVPYTYSDLIKANARLAKFYRAQINKLEDDARKAKSNGKKLSDDNQAKLAGLRVSLGSLEDDIRRYRIGQVACHDATVLIQ